MYNTYARGLKYSTHQNLCDFMIHKNHCPYSSDNITH